MIDPQLAAHILQRGKQLAPDRFTKPNPDTVNAWAKSLRNYPPQLWEEAIHLWAEQLVTDRMATPQDLNHAARATVSRWESDPQKATHLRNHREQQTQLRDQQLKDGTFAQLRGYTPPRELERPPVPDHILNRINKRLRRKP